MAAAGAGAAVTVSRSSHWLGRCFVAPRLLQADAWKPLSAFRVRWAVQCMEHVILTWMESHSVVYWVLGQLNQHRHPSLAWWELPPTCAPKRQKVNLPQSR